MPITTISSREFNQNTGRARNAARNGPVFITHRDKSAHVLLSFEAYRQITGQHRKIADLLAMPRVEDLELELALPRDLARPADFS